jgi:hypothetical protein
MAGKTVVIDLLPYEVEAFRVKMYQAKKHQDDLNISIGLMEDRETMKMEFKPTQSTTDTNMVNISMRLVPRTSENVYRVYVLDDKVPKAS